MLSLLYLGAELIFNRQLLDISSSVRSDPLQVEHIQFFGRMASGLGFTLLTMGIFQQFGFRIVSRKQWFIFSLVAFLCLMPFVLTFGQAIFLMIAGDRQEDDVLYTEGMVWAFIPFVGLYLVLAFKGKKPLAVVIGLMILAWPAMFYGQKLAVERFIISPTTTEDRLNAHYVLLLRSGIEDCIVLLEGTPFCDEKETFDIEKRSTRAVLGSLFMLNTKAVFKGLSFSRDQIIDSIAAQDMWFSSKEYYQHYLQQVADKRQQYEQFLDEKYYQPYRQASDLYIKSYNNAANLYIQPSQDIQLKKMAEDAAAQVEQETEKGWQQYRSAAAGYNRLSAGNISQVGQGLYADFCKGHSAACQQLAGREYNGVSIDKIITQAQTSADEKFYQQTGYPPDIRDKDEFLRNTRTQDDLRRQIENKIREQIENYKLPPAWQYDPSTFKDDLYNLLKNEAQRKALTFKDQARKLWQDKVQAQFKTNIDPGLSREDFFKRLGVDPLPSLKDLVLSEKDFREKYILPLNRNIADQTLEKIKKEAPAYANRHELAEQGKDYIRVLYIPAIALCLSIIIVVITIGRYLTALGTEVILKMIPSAVLAGRRQGFVRPFCWAIFISLILSLPYLWPNPYTSTPAYQKYYHLARKKSVGTAALLDWVVHMQPVIYRAGGCVPEIETITKKIF